MMNIDGIGCRFGGVPVRDQFDHPQQRVQDSQIPARVQHLQVFDDAVFMRNGTVCQREAVVLRAVPGLDREVGIIPGEIRENFLHSLKTGLLRDRSVHIHTEDAERFGLKDVLPAFFAQMQHTGLPAKEEAALMQPFDRSVNKKTDRERLPQADPFSAVQNEPETESVGCILVKVQQPAVFCHIRSRVFSV